MHEYTKRTLTKFLCKANLTEAPAANHSYVPTIRCLIDFREFAWFNEAIPSAVLCPARFHDRERFSRRVLLQKEQISMESADGRKLKARCIDIREPKFADIVLKNCEWLRVIGTSSGVEEGGIARDF